MNRLILLLLGLLCLASIAESKKKNQMEIMRKNKYYIQMLNQHREKTDVSQLVKNVKTKFYVFSSTIDKNKVNKLANLGLPTEAVKEFEEVYGSGDKYNDIKVKQTPKYYDVTEGLGAIEIEDPEKDDADIAYVEAHTTADIIQQYKVERVKSCKGKSDCKDNVWRQPRPMTESEIAVVKKALIDRVEEDLINRVNYLLSLS